MTEALSARFVNTKLYSAVDINGTVVVGDRNLGAARRQVFVEKKIGADGAPAVRSSMRGRRDLSRSPHSRTSPRQKTSRLRAIAFQYGEPRQRTQEVGRIFTRYLGQNVIISRGGAAERHHAVAGALARLTSGRIRRFSPRPDRI